MTIADKLIEDIVNEKLQTIEGKRRLFEVCDQFLETQIEGKRPFKGEKFPERTCVRLVGILEACPELRSEYETLATKLKTIRTFTRELELSYEIISEVIAEEKFAAQASGIPIIASEQKPWIPEPPITLQGPFEDFPELKAGDVRIMLPVEEEERKKHTYYLYCARAGGPVTKKVLQLEHDVVYEIVVGKPGEDTTITPAEKK